MLGKHGILEMKGYSGRQVYTREVVKTMPSPPARGLLHEKCVLGKKYVDFKLFHTKINSYFDFFSP